MLGSVLLGLVILAVIPGLVVLVALGSAYFTARRLGIPEFRPFRHGAPDARTKRFVVRVVSVLAAFATCFVLGALAAKLTGIMHSTMFVDVHPGPARTAGLRDGDRIVSMDGKPYDDFDELRADIQSSSGPRSVTFERNGERFTREVDPMPERRFGVSARAGRRPATVGEAAETALAICFAPFRYFGHFFELKKEELSGPVGIVKSAASAGESLRGPGYLLWVGALFAAFVWPVLALLNLVDVIGLSLRRNDR